MPSGVSTWGDTMRKAAALDEIIATLARYLPPDSGVDKAEVVSEIIGIIETRTNYKFMRSSRIGDIG